LAIVAVHETFGYYAQGVSVTTAVLPAGWRERLVMFRTPGRFWLALSGPGDVRAQWMA
jgi:hypothetical protein